MNKALKILCGGIVLCIILGSQYLNINTVDAAQTSVSINNVKKLQPLLCIDAPVANAVVSNNVNITGWALSSIGIANVKIFIDGSYIKNAAQGLARPDVDKVYPNYINGVNSGYSYNLDTSKLTVGSHSVMVQALGNDGVVNSVKINVKKLQPLLCIDAPIANTVINNSVNIKGWALSSIGIANIKIFVDGSYIKNATQGLARPDVDKVYPNYINGVNSGYSYTLDTSKLTIGSHSIMVQALGNDGIVNKSSVIIINANKLQPKLCIDYPSANSVIRDSVAINGWALSCGGIANVKIFVDGSYIKNATQGLARSDVNKVYPNYVNGVNSGYNYTLNTSKLTTGSHSITVQALGNDGVVNSMSVNVKKLQPLLCIDSPVANAVISNSINIKGWALSYNGVANVKIFVDGSYIKDTTIGLARPDVDKIYPNYINGVNSGYSSTLDTSKLTIGSHSITMQALGNDGVVNKSSVKILKGNNGKMQVTDNLAGFTANYEGYSATPYTGVDTQNKTIGYGHVITSGETYNSLSKASALVVLKQDLQIHVSSVNVFTTGVNISQQQFDALVDFAYNCGDNALMQSTLLKEIKMGASLADIKVQFLAWVKCNGVPYTGLYRRRMDEFNMFAYGNYARSYISAPTGYK